MILIVVASLVSAFNTVNNYDSDYVVRPAGPSGWVHLPTLGLHSGEPEYWTGCISSNPVYLADVPIDQAGWPLRFEYDDFAGHQCRSGLYPIPYLIDALFFAAIYLALAGVVGFILRHRLLMRRQTIVGAIVVALAILLSCLSSKIAFVSQNNSLSPVFSSVTAYPVPFPIPFCSTFNSDVNKKCDQPATCGLLLPIFGPDDSRMVAFGWPVAYHFADYDGCSDGTFYPILFGVDVACYAIVLGGASWGVTKLMQARNKSRSNQA